ncbi:c-type cytochrome [Altererythrobacter soli]|uniref:C-type cytochrome n=1 Tax=Croceibacterium soli TaxID=1739690 RepID=A0A6I4UV56_9SPHN|nr:c-type cytochrome [Croceibacterium soli]MXP41393.1 c-type cytochrome [Croceibacterium soli]
MGLPALRSGSSAIPAACLALAAAGCTPEPVPKPFAQTGELVALSGGDAGPRGACHTCHGMSGEGDGNLTPRIAGLDPGYIARQLIFYADGLRQHEQMSWIARQLTDEQRSHVSDYYAGMEPAPLERAPSVRLACEPGAEALYLQGDPERGLEACATCHGRDGGDAQAGSPSLAGQPAPYVAAQLRAWRSGERYGDPQNVMLAAAQAMAEEEINPLADYIARTGDGSDRPGFPAECPSPRRRDPRSGA